MAVCRKKKKMLREKAKALMRRQLKMVHEGDEPDLPEMPDLFSLKNIRKCVFACFFVFFPEKQNF